MIDSEIRQTRKRSPAVAHPGAVEPPEPEYFVPLPRSFYEPSAEQVAPALLGQWLVRRLPEGLVAGLVVETEAYIVGDDACHAARGMTARNRVMFGPPGHSYVYFIYGCHFCVNAVCMPAGTAEAVLIRAVEPCHGLELARKNRPTKSDLTLTNGPGRLCQALLIGRECNGVDLCDPASGLFVAANGRAGEFKVQRGPLLRTPRIGINRSVELRLRFFLSASPWISRPAAFG
jgi:DNA-3-methyladenine glycosylase